MQRLLCSMLAAFALAFVSACATTPVGDLSGDWRFRVAALDADDQTVALSASVEYHQLYLPVTLRP